MSILKTSGNHKPKCLCQTRAPCTLVTHVTNLLSVLPCPPHPCARKGELHVHFCRDSSKNKDVFAFLVPRRVSVCSVTHVLWSAKLQNENQPKFQIFVPTLHQKMLRISAAILKGFCTSFTGKRRDHSNSHKESPGGQGTVYFHVHLVDICWI